MRVAPEPDRRRPTEPRRGRRGFLKEHRHAAAEFEAVLASISNLRRAAQAMDSLHRLRGLADHRSHEVRLSDTRIAAALKTNRRTWVKVADLLEDAGAIERVGRAVNAEEGQDVGWRLLLEPVFNEGRAPSLDAQLRWKIQGWPRGYLPIAHQPANIDTAPAPSDQSPQDTLSAVAGLVENGFALPVEQQCTDAPAPSAPVQQQCTDAPAPVQTYTGTGAQMQDHQSAGAPAPAAPPGRTRAEEVGEVEEQGEAEPVSDVIERTLRRIGVLVDVKAEALHRDTRSHVARLAGMGWTDDDMIEKIRPALVRKQVLGERDLAAYAMGILKHTEGQSPKAEQRHGDELRRRNATAGDCHHGTPGGQGRTRAGTALCPACRREAALEVAG